MAQQMHPRMSPRRPWLAKEWVLKDRKQEMYHCFAAAPGGMTIESMDELNNKVFEAPAGPFCDIEVYPLVDFAKQMDRFADLLERARPA